MDFIIVGILQDWELNVGSNSKSIAIELSKNHRVLYVNKALDRKTIAQEKDNPCIQRHLAMVNQKKETLFEVQPNLWSYYPPTILESLNWLPWDGLFLLFCRMNNRRLAADIRKAVERIGFKDCIIFNDNEMFRTFYLKEFLNPKLYLYYSRDNLQGVPYWKKHGASIEPKHIAKADLALANSKYLTDYCGKYNPNSHYIGQGCNISVFDAEKSYERPLDLCGIQGPIIGYVGAILSLRIDERILLNIAESRPDWSMVLVGPEDDDFSKSALHSLANVHFLGPKPYGELPSYLSHFDVCLNPQLVNEVTIGNYPLKVDEYLAFGKPTVVTKTAVTEIFEDCIYTAESPGEYPGLIEKSMKEDDRANQLKRISMAKSHSWENVVNLLIKAIDKKLAR